MIPVIPDGFRETGSDSDNLGLVLLNIIMGLHVDYVSFVIGSYQKRKADGSLAPRLIDPSPARLRDECVDVCKERFTRRDEGTLRNFFGPFSSKEDCVKKIEGVNIDKFKQLIKLLKNTDIDTDNKNIELLAWLLDLEGRPYDAQTNYAVINSSPTEDLPPDEPSDPIPPPPVLPTQSKKRIILYLSIVVILSVGFVTYFTNQQKCMYWAGDHYQSVSCNLKFADTLIVAYDPEKLNRLKKITDWNTITQNSIGKVWYVKVNGNIEFYTADGYHPTELQLRLRPITLYIINKYVANK